jgi:NADH-quinone oxidoreductase subunit H
MANEILRMSAYAVALLVYQLVAVLLMILWLRKILGRIQNRYGPNRVGPRGYAQTVADALKLFLKEDVIPSKADRLAFILAPGIVFLPAYLVYVVIPFGPGVVAADLNVGLLFISAIASVGVIGFIVAGWASNNKYSLLGGMRSAAQIVSYEVPLVLAMIAPVILVGSLRLSDIVNAQTGWWFVLISPIMAIVYLTAGLAEVNLTPFDMVEAESELVAGFSTEYSGMKFALFFLAEFANTFTTSAILTCLYLGGWHLLPFDLFGVNSWMGGAGMLGRLAAVFVFLVKVWAVVFFTMWIRATLPRIRVDQLMEFGWKALIPISLGGVLVNGLVIALPFSRSAQFGMLAALNWALLALALALGKGKRVTMGSPRKGITRVTVPERSRV